MNILVVQTGFLGDVILSSPVWSNVQRFFPNARCSVMTLPAATDLVRHHPAVAEVIPFDKRKAQSGVLGLLRMRAELKKRNFDIVISLHRSLRTSLLLWLAGIPKRYGFSEATGSFFYTQTTRRADLRHDVLRNLAIFRALGKEVAECNDSLSIYISEDARREADRILTPLAGKEFIAIAPGSVWATKRWTEEGYAEVIRHLQSMNVPVVLLGGSDDSEVALRVERLSGVSVLNVVGRASLLVSAEIIRRARALVTNDSAPLHFGSAMKTPVVAVFCATVPEFGFGPWKTPAEVLGVAELKCRPCGRHGGKTCPTGTHACQRNLPAPLVIDALQRLLDRASEERRTGEVGA